VVTGCVLPEEVVIFFSYGYNLTLAPPRPAHCRRAGGPCVAVRSTQS